MVTGQRAFEADSPFAKVGMIVKQELANPSMFNPQVSTNLEKMIIKMYDKDPHRRHKTVKEVLENLEACTRVRSAA